MGNCLRCGVLLRSTNPKAKYCGGVCRVMASRERDVSSVGDGVEWLLGVDGLRRRMSKDLVLELMSRYGISVGVVENGAVVLNGVVGKDVVVPSVVCKSDVIAGLRGIISDVMGGSVSNDSFVIPDAVKVDYVRMYEGCELEGDYRKLWELIAMDVDLSVRERNEWKIKLGVR